MKKYVMRNAIEECGGTDSIHHIINLRSMYVKNFAYTDPKTSKFDFLTKSTNYMFLKEYIKTQTLEEASEYNTLTFVSVESAQEWADGKNLKNSVVEVFRRHFHNNGESKSSPYNYGYSTSTVEWVKIRENLAGYYDMVVVDGKYKMFFPVWEELVKELEVA